MESNYYKQKMKIVRDKKLTDREKENAKINLWFDHIYGSIKPDFDKLGMT